jgi:predicted nuclease of predicted toxin-antitoxin system
MGTLSSELSPHAAGIAGQPRVYVDANMPARLVTLMRTLLNWDVLYVLEHDELRRASDALHFRLAGQLRRTLVTLDRDYLDDRKFPPAESPGVLVLTAPNENGLAALLKRLDRDAFRAASDVSPLPFEGHKIHVHVDWRAGEAAGR